MGEYRLDELSVLSGVSIRNIRAYRERGLLDPPRREGRSAFYGANHLSQLRTINELLRRGFTSAHIADFFAGMRQGHDLADILGLRQAIFGSPQASAAGGRVDPDGDEARRLKADGLAEDVDDEVALVNPCLAEIVAQATDPHDYLRAILRVSEGITEGLDDVAGAVVKALEDSLIARFGANYEPRSEDVPALRRILADYRAMGKGVVADRLDAALRRHLVDAVSKYTDDAVLSGHGEPADR